MTAELTSATLSHYHGGQKPTAHSRIRCTRLRSYQPAERYVVAQGFMMHH
jgi:hypothetical protein